MGEPTITDKRWSIDLEKRIQAEHDVDPATRSRYAFRPDSGRELFVIDTPPPYPSGTWHIGAVAQYSMIDVIARSQRLLGKEVKFPWGVDRNGINIEFTVEKKTGRKMKTYDRAEFLRLCQETIETYTQAMRTTARRVGLSCDYDNEYLTDAPDYRAVTQAIFVDLFERGDVIEDLRPNIYDPVEGTTIADAEVERLERQTDLVDVWWDLLDADGTPSGEQVLISTTRPELVCACGIVMVHPDDPRNTHLIGRLVAVPISDEPRSVTIAAHPSVRSDFGSGVLMVCSFGDQNDVAVFRELGLTPYQAIGLDGCMTDVAGPLAGLPVIEARAAAIEFLRAADRIAAIEPRMQEIPVSERGKNPVETILLKEWYVRQTHAQDRIRELLSLIDFVPPRNKQILLDWMENITIDWPISRRRWYHTEVPIWYADAGTKVIVPPAGTYVQPWHEDPPPGSRVLDRGTRVPLGDWDELRGSLSDVTGEVKVFDTWMDSSNSNLFVAGYLNDPTLFDRVYPHETTLPRTLRPQGKEIVRTWLYYTLLKSTLLLDRPGFKHVWVDGLGMDPWGRKMSKSLGNGIDADSVLECGAGGRTGSWKVKGPDGTQVHLQAKKIGSECFRLWKATDAQVGDDFQINPEEIEAKYFGVLTKQFNVARFASQFEVPDDLEVVPEGLAEMDRWLLAELAQVHATVIDGYTRIDLYTAGQALKTFGTGVLPSHWLEMAKHRLYDGDGAAAWTLHRVLRHFLSLFAPICPFFSHHLSTTLYGTSALDVRDPPAVAGGDELGPGMAEGERLRGLTVQVEAFNSAVWKAKKDAGQSLNTPISGHAVPEALVGMADHLTAMHRLE